MTEITLPTPQVSKYRIEGIAQQAMLVAGIDYTGLRLQPDGTERRVTRVETLQQMTGHVKSCPEIGSVGHALLRSAGLEL